jgi:drug/metabolite transporter (DMT)-like permease
MDAHAPVSPVPPPQRPAQPARGGDSAPWSLVPALFVLIWSTGFIVARYAAPHAPPLTFLSYRYAGTLVVMLAIIAWTRAPWPRGRRAWLGTALVGLLMQAAYLGGVWVAIARGMPAGVSALIVGTQPLLTAILAGTIGERASARQWVGLLLGFAGVCLVLSDRLTLAGVGAVAIFANLLALAGITAGTLLQKQVGGGVDLRTGSAIQFGASLLVTLPVAAALENLRIDATAPFWIALAWSIFGLSLVAITLLLWMIRHGRATAVAGLMYLTPVVTALMAWTLFDQRLGLTAWLGVLVTVGGVALASLRPSKRSRI